MPRKRPRQERSRFTVEAILEAARDTLVLRRGQSLEATLRALIAHGVAAPAVAPALHRAFAEHMPPQRYREIEEADAPVFAEMRRFLEHSAEGVPDIEFALWMVATTAHAAIHNGVFERPDDVESGRLADELAVLLLRYLKRPRSRHALAPRRQELRRFIALERPFLTARAAAAIIPKPIMGAQDTRELLPGTLDMLILKVLSRGEMHGYGIVSAIQRASDDVLGVVEGALYPALHRLEVRGWVRSKWGASDNNRRAKFYRLSALGRRALDEEAAYWNRVSSAVTRVMQSA